MPCVKGVLPKSRFLDRRLTIRVNLSSKDGLCKQRPYKNEIFSYVGPLLAACLFVSFLRFMKLPMILQILNLTHVVG